MTGEDRIFAAMRCPNGHLSYPEHPVCPECGEPPGETVDLSEHTAEVLTWTRTTATPPGVREPNELAIVEFEIDGETVRALGQTTDAVEIGTTVEPIYTSQLRDPGAGIKSATGPQAYDGWQFAPL